MEQNRLLTLLKQALLTFTVSLILFGPISGLVLEGFSFRNELMRAVRRSNPRSAPDVRDLFERVAIISLDGSVYDEAGLIAPMELRTLDAIHLSAARLLGEQLDGMLCYDDRLSEAAEYAGIRVFSPR